MGSLQQLSVVKGSLTPVRFQYIHKIFEENVDRKYGQNVAVLFKEHGEKERSTTYNVLNSTANRMAHALLHRIQAVNKSSPNQDGDFIVAVCMKPSDNLLITLLAIWKAGAAYLPLDPTFPRSRIDHIVKESKPVLVVYDDATSDPGMFDVDAVKISTLLATSANHKNSNIPIEQNLSNGKNDLAIVLYTSGSTGVPKGCRLPHSIIQNRLEWQFQRFPFSSTEKNAVFKTALTFVDSVAEIFGPLLHGLRLIVVPKDITVDPEKLVAILEEYRIERLVLVPTLLRSLLMYLPLQKRSDLLYNLKIWVCSGEPLAVSLAKQFFDYFVEGVHVLCNFYGSTEIMGDVSYFVCESRKQLDNFEKGVPIGIPVNNTIIYLLDPHLDPVKNGEIGELYCAGLNLIKGYVNGRDPERFIENPLAVDPTFTRLYRTGDFASFQKGNIVYEGRTDSQIKIRGMRVDLSEVEKSLYSLPGIDKAMVLCYHAGEVDQALLGFATLTTNENGKELYQSGLQVEALLKEKLPIYMVPQIMLIDTVPLLVNGKVDRQSLLKMYENTNNNDDTAVALEYDYSDIADSQLAIAKDLFETIGAVLGRSCRKKISKHVNFYELGGNSLNSIYTVTELRDKNYYISITNFLAAENLGQVLAHICNASESVVDGVSDATANNMNLKAFALAKEHKADTIDIITKSFFEKADLEQWLKPNIKFTDYGDILEDIWDVLIDKELSFIVKDGDDRSVGVSMNFDARDEPEVNVKSKLIIVFEFLEFLEGPIRDEQLPPGKILHSFMMGTHSALNAQDNVTVMNFMESEVLALAKNKQFAGIFTTNTNPLTQQLGNVYGYKTMLDYQVNQYQYSDGTRPFARAPKEQRAVVHWKDIRQ